ncbi:hypothetical protein F4811DRAFT_350284 [Daldinia bambusicola]|nr:hypothetical protein F4811DRAFT_350284 [Daldinia bambusicola]
MKYMVYWKFSFTLLLTKCIVSKITGILCMPRSDTYYPPAHLPTLVYSIEDHNMLRICDEDNAIATISMRYLRDSFFRANAD